MGALRDNTTPYTGRIDSYLAGALVAFGAALIRSAAGVAKGAQTADTDAVIGFAVQPADGVVLDNDGFYSNSGRLTSQPDAMRVARDGEIVALVIATADVDIEDGDYLEVASVGGASPGYHGVLQEAGSSAGTVRTTHSVAKARQDVDMGSASYATPASGVSVGDSTITMSAGAITTMGLAEGDFIMLRDVNGNVQLNRVKSLTSTVITLEIPSTVALVVADTDLVNKVFQCRAEIL